MLARFRRSARGFTSYSGRRRFRLVDSRRKRVSRTFSVWLFALSMLAALVTGGASADAQDKKRVAVVAFEGPSASTIQAQVIRGLK